MASVVVNCSHITKSFHTQEVETLALRGIDLTIYTGEFMMLVGPSGCGKTTLISVIAGILQPDQGDCVVKGYNYKQMSSEELLDFRAFHVGFIFQSFNLIPTLTVIENVAIPLIIQGMDYSKALFQAEKILHKVGLGNRLHSVPNQLSGGQQQRVAIARALVHNPTILICDEPTSALDHDTGIKILEMMRSINQEFKTTFIVVTHDTRIYPYADRIAHMDDGKIIRIANNHDK